MANNKIANKQTRIRKLRKLEEILKSKIKDNQSVFVSEAFESLSLDDGSERICVYVRATSGWYIMYMGCFALKFKSVNSVADFIQHTFIETEK